MEIKVRTFEGQEMPEIIKKGEWIDLRAYQDMSIGTLENALIPLGVAMQIPEGYEAVIAPRSSSFKHWGIMQTNSIGIVDSSYSGNNDQWMMPVIAFRNTEIKKGDRVCQFRVQLSQKATVWQKLKWLFSKSIVLKEVCTLDNPNRGGIGSTGKQ